MKALKFLTVSMMTIVSMMLFSTVNATTQYSRLTGLSCSTCHTVFPRLNFYGDQFLRNGYQSLESAHATGSTLGKKVINDNLSIGNVSDWLGFRVNITPVSIKQNGFTKDSTGAKGYETTIGNPNWIQFFVTGAIMDDVSFFVEMEFAGSAFKNNWFYFNFTNLLGTKYLNLQAGNISPLEYASYPNRLPQLPALKSTVMQVTSDQAGKGAIETNDMSSARTGIQYYGYNELGLVYAGISTTALANSPTNKNDKFDYWGGVRVDMPEDVMGDIFEGSNATIHYYAGTNSTPLTVAKTGTKGVNFIYNEYTRISPQINIRYDEKLDVQFAYVMGTDNNFNYTLNNPVKVKFSGIGLEANYLFTDKWYGGFHYDNWTSTDKIAGTTKLYLDPSKIYGSNRFVPQITYIWRENFRVSLYSEIDLRASKDSYGAEVKKTNQYYVNIRTMF